MGEHEPVGRVFLRYFEFSQTSTSKIREKFPCFYSVIEARDFSHFNQSAQALLKGYFIIRNNILHVP